MRIYLSKVLAGKRNLAALATCLVLFLYIGFLIISNYQSQIDLQKTALEKWSQDTEKLAMSVSYFFAERKSDLKNLSANRALAVYFENKALGMSMEYGLKASLNTVIYRFNHFMEEKKIGVKRIYTKITFIRPNGELLVDTGATNLEQDQGRDWNEFLTPDSRDVNFIDKYDPQIPMMIVTTPYFFKDNFSGQLAAWVNLKNVYEHLVKKGEPINGHTSFVSVQDHLHSAEYLQAKFSPLSLTDLMRIEIGEIRHIEVTDHTGINRDMIVIRVPIKGTPLSLTRAMPASDILGRRSPLRLIVAMGLLTITVLVGMILFGRIAINNIVLEARFDEASKRKQEIEEKNRQLEKEINERKKAEETLQESEEKYRTLVKNIPSIVYTGYKDWSVDFFDQKIELLSGYDVDEFNSRKLKWNDIIVEEDIKNARESFVQALKTDKSFVREYRIKSRTGNIHWLQERGHIVCDDKGEIEHVSGTFFDITEHKQMEEALQKSEERYRTLYQGLSDALFVHEVKDDGFMGCFLEVNDVACRRLGYTRDELLKMSTLDIDAADSGVDVLPMLRSLAEGISVKFDQVHVTKDGQRIPVEINARPFELEGKAAVMSIVRDITERKQAEEALQKAHDELERRVEERTGKLAKANEQLLREIDERTQMEGALRESEKKHRTFMEANPDPVVVYDMKGKVAYFNPAFTRAFGWTQEEYLGKEKDIFVPEEAWPETNMMTNKMLAGENISGFETSRYTKEGNIIPVSISGALYRDKDDNPVGSIINLRDIREQKSLEAQLQRSQKMEALGLLAGGVAHDLNNVLFGIVSYPDLLLMQIPEDSPLRKPILTMQDSGKKAADIVQDLLTLARRGVVTEKVVNLNNIISEYLKTPEYEKLKSYHPRIEVETSLESDPLNITGSSVHLSKVVMNLVSNAVEAMLDGGKILISTKNRYIDRPVSGYDSIEEGDYVALTVSDTGVGISSEEIKRIFEPFYTKKIMGRSGTGLGMAVVWGTVKDHNGYIDVQSTEGKGTTFTLYFPATRQEIAQEKGILPVEKYMGEGESILVVDDVKEQGEIVFKLLTTLGYVVDIFSSGEEAVEYLKENRADLIVLDMIMDPGIDGLDTYKRILELHPDQKAIIASGFSETDRVKEAQRLGAGAYLKKPYTLEKIGIAVKAELGK